MNILITGITGLFGSQLAREFSALGTIHGLRREESKLDKLSGLNIHWHTGELSNMESLLESLKSIDLVIHSAGMVSFSSKDKEKLYEVNAVGTGNLVNAMLAANVTKLIHVSSVAAIGRSPELSVIDENFKWTESPWNTEYGVSKYWAELEAWRGEQEGLDLIVINPSVLLGKVDYGKSSSAIYAYALGGNKFFPKGDLNYIDIRDAAKITRLLFEMQVWGERYILSKESLSYREFFGQIASVFGKKSPSVELPDWLAKVASSAVSLLRFLKLSSSPLNKQTAMLAQQKIRFDNSKVQQLLKFPFHTLRETLEWAKTP